MKNNPLNIVIIGNFPYPNGFAGTKRVQQYLDFFHKQGIESMVLVLAGKPFVAGNESSKGVHRNIPYQIIGRDMKLGWRLPLSFLQFLREGTKTLKERKNPEVANVLFHYGEPSIDNIWFLLRARKMGYIVIHDLVEDYDLLKEPKRGLLYNLRVWTKKRFSRFIPRLSDGLVVISRHLEQKYRECGLPQVLIPIGARTRLFPAEAQMHSPVRIVYAGTYGEKDGIHILLEAFKQVRAQYPDCILQLVGGRRSPLQDYPQEWSNGVKYIGYIPDSRFYEFLAQSDIFCMTRVDSGFANAGFPFKLGEYLATGHPVVASRISNLEEYLEDRQNVLLVEPENVEELSGALLYLLRNPEQAIQIGINGCKICEEHFNPEINGQKAVSFFQTISQAR